MRPLLASLVVGVALVSPVARAEAGVTTVLPTFADIKWLSSPDVVKKQLEGRGYKYVTEFKSGDFAYQGEVSGLVAVVESNFNVQKQLVKISVRFKDSGRPYNIYKTIKPKLEEKYGLGYEITTLKSYMNGSEVLVGNAISTDVGKLNTYWNYKSSTVSVYIGVHLIKYFESSNDVYCTVIYEHDAWGAELKRRASESDL